MIKGDPKALVHDALRFTCHLTAWFRWRTDPPTKPVASEPDHKGKALELLIRINSAFGLPHRRSPTWQEWQFIEWTVDELVKHNPTWPRSLCIQTAIYSYEYFLEFEGTHFGDDAYDWTKDGAACIALEIGMAE